MFRFFTIPFLVVLLAVEADASTVVQRNYIYSYDSARDAVVDLSYMICERQNRPTLVPELPPLNLTLKAGMEPSQNILSPAPAEPSPKSKASVSAPELQQNATVLFPFDSSAVDDPAGLAQFAENLKKDPTVIGIKVKGFTCDIGEKSYNDRLAKRRAWAVAGIVGRTGLKVLDVFGEGNCCYVAGERELSRRAVISVVSNGGQEPCDAK